MIILKTEPDGGATGETTNTTTEIATAVEQMDLSACGGDYAETPQATNSIFLHVRDMSSGATHGRTVVTSVDISEKVSSLLTIVAKSFKYDPTSFSLVWQSKNADQIEIHNLAQDMELSKIFVANSDIRYNLIIFDLYNQPPRKADEDDLTLGASASPTQTNSSTTTPWLYPKDNSHNDFSSQSSSKIITFVGLVNQAMTCYLNSLLQTLFMTPEFRNALYRWEFTGTEEDALKSIPFQLQKLYLYLQTTARTAVETTSLTRSFGWDSNEAWQQHDIQELCRVMFDALEQCFKNTDQADLINNLYEGKMKDYVKCLECGTEGAREDAFLDIPLPIRPFGSSTAYKSVEEALRAFVEPELLTGNNKYECSKCRTLCDAHKGLKFTRFPYLLTIHLKRFDFDYQTFHRIKLNDEVTFPNHLDLNSFIESAMAVPSQAGTPDKLSCDKVDDASITDSGSAFDTEETNSVELTSTQSQTDNDTQDEDEGIDVSSTFNEKNKQHLSNGPYVYELFSIMVHSGSASGGHYYAYIRDFKTNEWFCFNDQTVSKITYDDIRKTYGGSNTRGYYWSSSANAYMLMYRQIDKERNVQYFSKEELPTHITNLVQRMVNEEEAEREAREIERAMIKLKIYYPEQKVYRHIRLKVPKETTLRETTKLAYEELNLESEGIPLERCRLVKFEDVHESIECSFDNPDELLCDLMAGFRSSYNLMMEVREEGKEFEEYKPGGTTVKVHIIDLASQEVEGPQTIRVNQNVTVRQLKEIVGKSFSMDPDKMRIVTEKYSGDFRPLSNDTSALKNEGFYKTMKIYTEASGEEPLDYFLGSQMHSVLERYENTITLTCQMENITKALLEDLQIPSLAEDEPEQASRPPEAAAADTPVQASSTTVPITYFPAQDVIPSCPLLSAIDGSVVELSSSTEADQQTHQTPLSGEVTTLNIIATSGTMGCPVTTVVTPPTSATTFVGRSTSLNYSQMPPTFTSSPMPSQPLPPPSSLPISSTSCPCAPSILLPSELSSQASTNCIAPPMVTIQPAATSTPLLSTFMSNIQASMQVAACSPRNSSQSAGNASEGEDEGIVDMDGATGSSSTVNSDQSASEDSSLTSDSDRTLVGDPPEEDKLSNTSESPDYHNVSSPEETKEKNMDDVWGLPPHVNDDYYDTKEEAKCYFKAHLPVEDEEGVQILRISVDKRITISQLKKELQKYVGVSHEHFKLFKIYSNSTQEFECTRMSETLTCFIESSMVKVQLSRALLPGEFKCKVYNLELNSPDEPATFLIDCVLRNGDLISKVKEAVIKDINAKNIMELKAPHLVRLRKKSWKNPLTIYPDHHILGSHINLYSNFELYLQVLSQPEKINKDEDEISVFVKRWRPSTYSTNPLVEVILRKHTIDELKLQISILSGIAAENVLLAKGRGSFPCDMSVLDVDSDLEWTEKAGSLDQKSFFIQDDGTVVYFKDKLEKTKKLSDSEKNELTSSENVRLNRETCLPTNQSKRLKEKGLRIYLQQNP